MKKLPLFLIFTGCMIALALVYFALQSEHSLVMHPKGLIARKELDLIKTNTFFILVLIVPTFFWILLTAWKYGADRNEEYEPEKTWGPAKELLLWLIPSGVVAIMSVITWEATHELDPYERLKSDIPPMVIQVVALDWKWLFIYPEEGIATVNFVQFPEKVPIRFELAADGSPMNSFWIPELSGQIYCMAGMITPLHLIADGPGVYAGRAAEINGEGYAKMTFSAKSQTLSDFTQWVSEVKDSTLQLDNASYEELLKPSVGHLAASYAVVEDGLFKKIIAKHGHCCSH